LGKRWFGQIGILAGLGVVYYVVLRPKLLTAGTETAEVLRNLPGDDLIVSPHFQATRAITIAAPVAVVWPWIAQLGRNHTGFYGIDSLSNHGIPSAAYLHQDIAQPQAGMELDEGYKIMALEPYKALIYGNFDRPTLTGDPMEITKLFWLEAVTPNTTRLIIRTRGYTYGMLSGLYNVIYEAYDFLETMQQLDNIRQRAETMAQLRGAETRLKIGPN